MNSAVGETFLESVYDNTTNTITIKPVSAHPLVQFLIWTDQQLELMGSPYAGKTINSILKHNTQKPFDNSPCLRLRGYVSPSQYLYDQLRTWELQYNDHNWEQKCQQEDIR